MSVISWFCEWSYNKSCIRRYSRSNPQSAAKYAVPRNFAVKVVTFATAVPASQDWMFQDLSETFPCGGTSREPCQTVSPHSGSSEASGVLLASLCCCHRLHHWYWRDMIMTARPCLVFLVIISWTCPKSALDAAVSLEVWPCFSSAPWLTLVVGSRENIFPTNRACHNLLSQHGASIPRLWSVLDRQHWSAVTTSFWLSTTTDYAANSTSHYWWPFIPFDVNTGMQQSCS